MRVAALLVSIAVTGAFVACGGGGGKPITLEAYFQAVKPLSNDLRANEAPLLATLRDSQNVRELKDALQAYPAVVDTYLKGLNDLKPPAQAKQAHDDAVTAGNQFHDALEKAIRDTEGMTKVDDFFGAADAVQISISSQGMAVACAGLQQVANDNKITVDLSCPAGS